MLSRARALALAASTTLVLCGSAGAVTPDSALARSLKASMKAFYARSVPDLALTTLTCKIASTGTTARCLAHFTIKAGREIGVFQVRATIDRSTGGVHTKTLSATCKDTKTGKPVRCRY